MTLPELAARFDTYVFNYVIVPGTVQEIAKANPLRWAICFVPDAVFAGQLYIAPQCMTSITIPFPADGSLNWLNNRDHPGLPQVQWLSDSPGFMGSLRVIEIVQNIG